MTVIYKNSRDGAEQILWAIEDSLSIMWHPIEETVCPIQIGDKQFGEIVTLDRKSNTLKIMILKENIEGVVLGEKSWIIDDIFKPNANHMQQWSDLPHSKRWKDEVEQFLASVFSS